MASVNYSAAGTGGRRSSFYWRNIMSSVPREGLTPQWEKLAGPFLTPVEELYVTDRDLTQPTQSTSVEDDIRRLILLESDFLNAMTGRSLFLTFAHLTHSQERILSFANSHGMLLFPNRLAPAQSVTKSINPNAAVPEGCAPAQAVWGESIELWHTAIHLMDRLVRLWQAIQDAEPLRELAEHSSEASSAYNAFSSVFRPYRYLINCCDRDESFGRGNDTDFARPVKFAPHESSVKAGDPDIVEVTTFLSTLVNNLMAGMVWPVVLPFIRFSEKEAPQLHKKLVADTLLGNLWLQFYMWITGGSTFRRCEVCGGWMDVTGKYSNKAMHKECSQKLRTDRWRGK